MRPGLLAALALVMALPLTMALAEAPAGDAIHLTSGDRISGKVVARGTKRVRIQTPYGLLVIPRSDIARIVGADGSEEIVSEPTRTPPEATAPMRPQPLRLSLVVTGASFWQAWDAKNAPRDPTLRLVLRLDESEVIAWSDASVDEGEIKGAIVNAFSFAAGTLVVQSLSEGVLAEAPAANPGRIVLPVALPADWTGRHRVGVAYQIAEDTTDAQTWRDVAWTVGSLELLPDRVAILTLEQDRGSMEYSGFPRRRMKNVETFRLGFRPE